MVKTKVVNTFPPGYFLEQIATTRAGGVFISCANREELYHVHGESDHPAPMLIHKYDRHQRAMGLVEAPHDPNIFYTLSSDMLSQEDKTSHLYILNMANPAAGSGPQPILTFPFEAKGLNGMDFLLENVLLVADSFASSTFLIAEKCHLPRTHSSTRVGIWRVDLELTQFMPIAQAQARVWLSDPRMAGELKLPDFQYGINGLKHSEVMGRANYTSTQQKVICQVRVNEKTLEPEGEVEVVAKGMQGDDLIVDDSNSQGAVAYVTTHRDNTVLRIPLDSKDSKRADDEVGTFLEGTELDQTMLGPTAGSWVSGQVGKVAYFTADGGLKNIVGGFVKCAEVVRVEF